ncbi:MAG: DUF6064 family protein [Armatimonadota bacterium]
MQVPFTVEQFLDVFAAYNTAIWPAQYLAYAFGVAIILYAYSDWKYRARIAYSLLAALWIFTGIGYHILHFSEINSAATPFGILFIIQGLLLLWVGWFIRPRFRTRFDVYHDVGLVFVVYAMVIYPLLGRIFGHTFPAAPVFGLTPCPLTIFTFGVLLWTDKTLPKWVPVIPFIWSLIGSTAAFSLGVPEDYGLLVAGVVGSIILWTRGHDRPGKDDAGAPDDVDGSGVT